ncbi:hypothetical protein KGF57_002274 [Candida theae]|uniref:Uncharacterized protein n=1 Tax=Candida theae TaxID=1198502 RepID=A0AAD5FZ34_9ASCO|nr:uncharacterized protein KGF57_002274 [Candida theae]KAI5958840.1 hypothetical protein KGF57_002274 [Candida theae]
MAKKNNKTNTSTGNSSKQIANGDNFARLNYLYQLSNCFVASSSSSPPIASSKRLQSFLARGYDRNLDLLSKRSLTKLSPSVKRTICKKCHVMLIPGMTMSIRIENKSKRRYDKNDVLVHKCSTCGECKRFPIGIDREYVPFFEQGYIEDT